MQQQPLTISDVAAALGMSKTTVSRAISGKGRVSAATSARVQAYIQEHNYRPNAVARALAESRTYNIALVISRRFSNFDLPFVRKSMTAVCETAAQNEYEILLTIADGSNPLPLRRLIDKGKIDGALLTTAVEGSPLVGLLQSRGVPFVVLGTLADKTVLQVDNDQVAGCKSMTSFLLSRGAARIAFLGGAEHFTVNCSRRAGYAQAYAAAGLPLPEDLVFTGLETPAQQLAALDAALAQKPDCLLCVDDSMALTVLKALKSRGIRVPQDIGLASLYDSEALAESDPPVTALHFDAADLARTACTLLLKAIGGAGPENVIDLGYQCVIRGSTW